MGNHSQQALTLSTLPPLAKRDTPEKAELMAIVRRLSIAQTLQDVIKIITEAARALVGADGVTFVLREGDLCLYVEEDAISPLWKGRRFPMSACISGWCMLERRPAVIPNIYEDDRIPQGVYRPTFVRSLAMVPVRQDDPIAAMGAYWARARPITDNEVELLQSVANIAAMALANVELQQERGRILMSKELQHRVRNSLMVVQSIVRQGLYDDLERAGDINDRIATLVRADSLLTSELAGPRKLKATLLSELEPHGESRFSLSGNDVTIAPDRARALALVIHELATNAAKYGAFSTPSGRVSVSWTIAGDKVRMIWQELGGPDVNKSGKRGFGTRFIEHMLASIGGGIKTEWPKMGIVQEMRFTLKGPHARRFD